MAGELATADQETYDRVHVWCDELPQQGRKDLTEGEHNRLGQGNLYQGPIKADLYLIHAE